MRRAQLHVLDVAGKATRRLTSGAFSVQSFDWSPDGKSIAFEHRLSEDVATMGTADISIVTVDDADAARAGVGRGPDGSPVWSPDGATIAFESAMGDPAFFYVNSRIATVPAVGGAPTAVTPSLTRTPIACWTRSGILFSALAKTAAYLSTQSGSEDSDAARCADGASRGRLLR